MWRIIPLAFESGVFGAPVGRVVPTIEGGLALAALAETWVRDGQWLVSARIATDDATAAFDLDRADFTPIETLVSLQAPLPQSNRAMPDGVALVRREERRACLEIARTAFRYDRFHVDPRVPNDGADTLKETWVANSLDGRADAVVVALEDGDVCGFVTCMVSEDAAIIDLIAVSPKAQGRGVGKRLVEGAIAHYAGHKIVMRVGTQDTNTASLALYASQGFVPVQRQTTYHWINASALVNGEIP